METLGYDVAQEYIGPLKNTIEVIDTHGILAKVTSENAEGKFSLFCPNHLLSKRKWLGTLPVDFFMTKKYLQSQ
ncbi:MAG: hypothetical protein WCH65_03550 [bacterium]